MYIVAVIHFVSLKIFAVFNVQSHVFKLSCFLRHVNVETWVPTTQIVNLILFSRHIHKFSKQRGSINLLMIGHFLELSIRNCFLQYNPDNAPEVPSQPISMDKVCSCSMTSILHEISKINKVSTQCENRSNHES